MRSCIGSLALCFALAGCPSEGPPRMGLDASVDGSDAPSMERDVAIPDVPLDGPMSLDAPAGSHAGDDAGGTDAGGTDAGPACPTTEPIDCSPGSGTGKGAECYGATSCFLRTVQNAINGVVRDNPTWFDASAGPTHVLQVELYMDAVVAVLDAGGLCAMRDPNAGDEIVVKHDNGFSENFDILTASEDVRSGGGIYTSTCAPAWF